MFINLMSLLIIVAGVFALFDMRKEAFPPVSFNAVYINTYFRGAAAEKVEKLVTIPLEREIRDVSNIKEIVSKSLEGMSIIQIELDPDVTDAEKTINDIQKAVDRVTDLPSGVEDRPVVTEVNSDEIPVIKVAVSGAVPERNLREYADTLKDQIEDLKGVASVKRSGWRDEEFWIEPDLTKMIEYHISFQELADALRLQNVSEPGGKQRYDGKEFMVKIQNELKTKEDIESTVVRANDLGNWITVKDIAYVRPTYEDELISNKAKGSRAITLIVLKRENGDIIKVVDGVYDTINKFKKHLPAEITISTFYDMSYYVKRRLKVLRSNGIVGFILVVLVLFVFLPPVPAFMTALGIPIAFFTTFCVMAFFDITVNLLTMFGLVMVLGIIVDDGIIISENVYRHIEQGMSPREAAVHGTNEVARPVLATVLTTLVAFSPLMFMSGIIGKFVRYIPLIVIIALGASLLEAFVILPSHLSDFARKSKSGKSKKETVWFKWLINKYTRILTWSLENRYKVAIGVSTLLVIVLVGAKLWLPFSLFSSEGIEQFSIRLEAETGTSLQRTNELTAEVEQLVAQMPGEYIDSYEAIVGELTEERGFDPYARQGSNYAQVNVYLTPYGERDKTAKEIMAMHKEKLEILHEKLKPQSVEKLYFLEFKEGPPTGRAIDVWVRGENFATSKIITDKIKAYLATLPGTSNISDNYDLGVKEINVIVDEEKAQQAFLTNTKIASAIRATFSGVVATTIKREKAEKEIKVLIRVPEEHRNSEDIFDKIVISNRYGNLIPLKRVTTFVETQGLRTYNHIDGKRFIAVTADVDGRKMTSMKANQLIIKKFEDISAEHPGYTLKFGGEHEETMESMQSLMQAFLIAVFLIFVILATQFNSLMQPFVVMLTIPFGIIGFILAFFIHREPLGFIGIMGFIGLTGVVVNDSIVLVDFINKRKETVSTREAVIDAGTIRLRPVLLTTITTVCGLATVAYGIGGMDPFLRPMALAMSWGLMFATGLTLIVIPCAYFIQDDLKGWFMRKRNKSA